MLKVFNDLKPFFEDNYRRINIREYARITKISPPSASKALSIYFKEELLCREKERNYIYYSANKESKAFIELSRAYWLQQFEKAGLICYLELEYLAPVIILFGSFSKAEVKQSSDIDIAVFSTTEKAADISTFEKRFGRKIQLFAFKTKEDVKNTELLNNMLNGLVLSGGW